MLIYVMRRNDHLQNLFDDSNSETDINEPEIAVQDTEVKNLNENTIVLRQIETELAYSKIKENIEDDNENNTYDWLGAFKCRLIILFPFLCNGVRSEVLYERENCRQPCERLNNGIQYFSLCRADDRPNDKASRFSSQCLWIFLSEISILEAVSLQ